VAVAETDTDKVPIDVGEGDGDEEWGVDGDSLEGLLSIVLSWLGS
jgi:hypothetical protein